MQKQTKPAKRSQIEKFRDKARELGADESEDKFDVALSKVAKANPSSKEIDDLAKMIGQPTGSRRHQKKVN